MLANLYPTPFSSPCCDLSSQSSFMMASEPPFNQDPSPSPPSQQRRRNQAPLAPRTSRDQGQSSSTFSSGVSGRLSHRSRAGCWTCRGRKVKCDERHPRCGPCQRLNRDCDWDHRWNFSDATSQTQNKYRNVKTAGNTVWDPQAPRQRQRWRTSRDDLPSFASLSNDDDRERKARARQPGTYAVVAVPSSFSDLPEYAQYSSPSSEKLRHGSLGSTTSSTRSRLSTQSDPNIVILDQFEDLPPSVTNTFNLSPRRASEPENFQQLSISTTLSDRASRLPSSEIMRRPSGDDYLVLHFRRYIAPRLVQPLLNGFPTDTLVHGCTRDIFEIEAARFPPLHHAICAVSALNLAYNGRCALEDAMQHYHQALSSATTPTVPDDLISDGVFLRHFLLFIYDISVQMSVGDGGQDMWAEHLIHLRRIALQRHAIRGPGHEPHAYTLWSICELDVYACLLGNGHAEFVHTIVQDGALPPLHQQIPSLGPEAAGSYLPSEIESFPAILALNQGIVLQTAKIAQTAQAFRDEAAKSQVPSSPGSCARWQAGVSGLQRELLALWEQLCPDFVGPESAHAGAHLPDRVRHVFQHALLLYQTAQIYLRTSMFPGQRLLPTAAGSALQNDTDARSNLILTLASNLLAPPPQPSQPTLTPPTANHATQPRRSLVFPLFIAGTAASSPNLQARAMDLITVCERQGGIGQNTYCTRQLLGAFMQAQRDTLARGGRVEVVEWIGVAREMGYRVVNCGL